MRDARHGTREAIDLERLSAPHDGARGGASALFAMGSVATEPVAGPWRASLAGPEAGPTGGRGWRGFMRGVADARGLSAVCVIKDTELEKL